MSSSVIISFFLSLFPYHKSSWDGTEGRGGGAGEKYCEFFCPSFFPYQKKG